MTFSDAATSAGLRTSTGKDAIERRYRSCIETAPGLAISHSVNIDDAYLKTEPQSSRWDYGIGLVENNRHFAIWIEPHGAASTHEVERVLHKLSWVKAKLRSRDWFELNSLTEASKERGLQQFWWLVPGTVCFNAGSKEGKRLAQAGMRMPTKKVTLR